VGAGVKLVHVLPVVQSPLHVKPGQHGTLSRHFSFSLAQFGAGVDTDFMHVVVLSHVKPGQHLTLLEQLLFVLAQRDETFRLELTLYTVDAKSTIAPTEIF